MTHPTPLTDDILEAWANNPDGPVALHLKQRLVPVEGVDGVIFPPTYADIGYNIDALPDGTKVATIDSVGSQANRMEPIFKQAPLADLVPQIDIVLNNETTVSLLDLAHRAGDAVVRAAPGLNTDMAKAFATLKNTGDAGPLAALAPTSLLYGVWDSRGDSQEKRPRLVRSVIRAWDVDILHGAAQFNSVWKQLSDNQKEDLQKEAKTKKVKLSEKGFADAPGVFRDKNTRKDRVLGGVIAKGDIRRDVTVNLVVLRGLRSETDDRSQALRRYMLGLVLLSATAELPLYLREGCFLKFADAEDRWVQVHRRSADEVVDLTSDRARALIEKFAAKAAEPFKNEWPEERSYSFDVKEAKKLLGKKDTEEEQPG